jgi:D-3-phosphoglycerate dehydrogenase
MKPYISLAEKLGSFESQVVSGGIEEVDIEFSGEILNYDITPITIALIKGLLTPILRESVNYVNAPIIAKGRGIKVVESKSSEAGDYKSAISITVKTSKGASSATGAIFGKQAPRIVVIDKFTLDVIPEGYMLVLYNYDKPGVIGSICSTLGNDNVNIARLHLGREQVDGKALVVLSTDSLVSEATMEKLKVLPHIISVTRLEM